YASGSRIATSSRETAPAPARRANARFATPVGWHARTRRGLNTRSVALPLLGVPGLWLTSAGTRTLRRMATTDHSTQLNIGFIGLGDQGAPMAQAIAEAGWPLHVWARHPHSLAVLADTPHTTHDTVPD